MIGKIAPIEKAFSNSINTIDQQLAKNGYTRFPGTTETFLPYKELSGKYRNGLDPTAEYLKKLPKEAYEAEVERITKLKKDLEDRIGVSGILEPTSPFWNFATPESTMKQKFGTDLKVVPVKLGNETQYFDLNSQDIMKVITWCWIKVHPGIAPSLEAYKQGAVSADTKYYVVDDEAENKDTYNRKKEINKAIVAFESLTPTKRKQISRLMGIPVTESTTEEVVYNLMDTQLKETEFKSGAYKGLAPVKLFNELLAIDEDRLKVKDLIEQAFAHNIYRYGTGGKVLEGTQVVASDKNDLTAFLLDEKNQMDLIALEKKLEVKKIEKVA